MNVHKDLYREAKLKVNSLIGSSKLSFYDEKILQRYSDHKSQFECLDRVYHQKQVVLPEMQPAKMVTSFNDYLVKKIQRICKDLDERSLHLPPHLSEYDIAETHVVLPHYPICKF